MSDAPKQQPVSNKVVEVLVSSIFRKNGLKTEELKTKVSDEQKEMIKEMVEDLKVKVDQFNQKNEEENKE